MTRVFLVAGEASGDAHGAALAHALRDARPGVLLEGLGGPKMADAGVALRHDLASSAIMGFVEVVKHLRPIRRLFLDTVAHLKATRPDVVVLIDYPGFNLRLTKALHGTGIPIVYYISPQVWAWKQGRIHALKQYCRKMLVIFPFEVEIYRNIGMDCTFVGHPLLEHIDAHQPDPTVHGDPAIGLLPGSRAQEIERLLPVMLDAAREIQRHHPGARFHTPCVNEARAAQIRALAGDFPLDIRVGGMYATVKATRFCLVASGTATLETALLGTPFVIVYRTNPLTFWLAKRLVRVDHIGIVNILLARRAVPERLQTDATPATLAQDALTLLPDSPQRTAMLQDFTQLRTLLGGPGASQRAATAILQTCPHP